MGVQNLTEDLWYHAVSHDQRVENSGIPISWATTDEEMKERNTEARVLERQKVAFVVDPKKRQRQEMMIEEGTSIDNDNNAEQWAEIEELDAVHGEACDEDLLDKEESQLPDDRADCSI